MPKFATKSANQNKTRQTGVAPEEFLAEIEDPRRRAEGEALLALFGRAVRLEPRMWGPSIVGYGRYRYLYESGREGEFMLTGFSPRKSALTLYIMPGFDAVADRLERLGRRKLGKSCLYLPRLDGVDQEILVGLIAHGVADMRERYESWDA